MSSNPRNNVYKRVTESLLAELEKGTLPWRKPWSCAASGLAPRNITTLKPYRGINAVILALSPYSSPYWLTFKQAKGLGAHVRRGEKGTPIVVWKRHEKRNEETQEVQEFMFCRVYTVFNVDQVEGLPKRLVELAHPTDERTPMERLEAAESVIRGYVNRPTGPRFGHDGGDRAFYRPSEDRIAMPEPEDFESPHAYYSTAFHEMTHSTGHRDRLAREGVCNPIRFGSHDYAEEELVAEFGASMLRAVSGIDKVEEHHQSAAYVANWLRKCRKDPGLLVRAAGAAQKAADRILEAA